MSPLKNLLPKSLLGRFFVIIIVPAVLVQAVAAYIFYERHWDSVSRHMVSSLAGEIAMIAESSWQQSPEESRQLHKAAWKNLYLSSVFYKDTTLHHMETPTAEEFRMLQEELGKHLISAFRIYSVNSGQDVQVDVQLSKGVLSITASKKRLKSPTTYIFMMWLIGTGVLMMIISLIFTKNQVRAITRLADAAEKFGKGQDISQFKAHGALEVRKAASAFLTMHDRIRRQILQRTEMLAGISHDLRTPLTRMRLQLALMGKNDDVAALENDIKEMETMIQEYLDFARGEGGEEPAPVEIDSFLQEIVGQFRNHTYPPQLTIEQPVTLSLRPQAFRRALMNLLENGLRYGTIVHVHTYALGKHYYLVIDDDGPGISEAERPQVFKPFYRVEHSRNSATGGVGLGLSIARDIIASHGGDIELADSPQGGLRVIVKIPR